MFQLKIAPKQIVGRVIPGEVGGELEPVAFQAAMFDLVNFMTYIAEPSALKGEVRHKCVIIYSCFLCVCLLLNREYWKDIDH